MMDIEESDLDYVLHILDTFELVRSNTKINRKGKNFAFDNEYHITKKGKKELDKINNHNI